MDKLKKVFSPGSKKDDEVLYGDAAARRASATDAPTQSAPEQLHPVEGSDQKDHSILRQIINPSGDKYDAQRFGTTASTQAPVVEPGQLQTNPDAEKNDHTIMRQILNPNNAKYDEQLFSETAATGGDRKNSVPATAAPAVVGADTQLATNSGRKDHSILRQIFNPHGDKYDEQGYGSTAHAVDDSNPQALRSDPVSNPDHSITRQILNPGQEKYDPTIYGSSQPAATGASSTAPPSGIASTQQTLPDRTINTTATTTDPISSQPLADRSGVQSEAPLDQAHHERDGALAGTGIAATAAAAGGAGYYASNHGNADERITDRPHPLAGSAGDASIGSDSLPNQNVSEVGQTTTTSGPHPVGPAGGAHVNPIGAPEERLTSDSSQLERDAVGGIGVGGITGVGASTQLNSAPSDVQDATYTDRVGTVG